MLHLLFNWEDNSSNKNPTIKVSADTRYFDFKADEDQSSNERKTVAVTVNGTLMIAQVCRSVKQMKRRCC